MKARLSLGIGLVLAATTAYCADVSVDRGRVGQIYLGMSLEAIYKVYPKETTKQVDLHLEGMPTPALQVFLNKQSKNPSLVIRLEAPNGTISGIDVRDARFKLANGIGIGSSLGQLRKAYKNLSIDVSEGDVFEIIRELNISFVIQLKTANLLQRLLHTMRYKGKDNPLIPNDAKIVRIWVHR